MQNSTLAALTANAPQHVINAIQGASRKTGVDFAYMVQQAKAESAFNPSAKARTSSATGLYQFIESTWMTMVEKHGEKYGIDTSADKQTLLNLRKDPKTASFMAAEFARENKEFLEDNVKGEIGATEMYFAHFLGASGAAGFLNAMNNNPQTIAAHIFPKESAANRNVFYDSKTGEPRTLEQVYAFFDKKFNAAPTQKIKPHVNSPVFNDTAPQSYDDKKTYVAIPQTLHNSIASLYANSQADAVTALLAFGQDSSNTAVNEDKPIENRYFAATKSLYSNTQPQPAYQKTASTDQNKGYFGLFTQQQNNARMMLSQLDLLSLYHTDVLA